MGGGGGGEGLVVYVLPGNGAGASKVASRVCNGDGRQASSGRGGKLSRKHLWREDRDCGHVHAEVVENGFHGLYERSTKNRYLVSGPVPLCGIRLNWALRALRGQQRARERSQTPLGRAQRATQLLVTPTV